MFKEIKHVVYLVTIFFSFFFVVKYYLSDKNIKQNNKIMFQYQKKSSEYFTNLPIIKNDTENIIEYKNEIEKYENKKKRKFWKLLK